MKNIRSIIVALVVTMLFTSCLVVRPPVPRPRYGPPPPRVYKFYKAPKSYHYHHHHDYGKHKGYGYGRGRGRGNRH